MRVTQLLQDLELLPYRARYRHMIALGRQAAHDNGVAALLKELEQGDFYERLLAIQACSGSYDGNHVLRALADPSHIIRGFAIKVAPLACNEEQLREALTLVPRDGRRHLLCKLQNHHAHALIDEFLERLAQESDPQFLKLLPFGSLDIVERYRERFLLSTEQANWRRLARYHSALACEMLLMRAEAATGPDPQLLFFANAALPILTEKEPDLALALVTALARHVPLGHIFLQPLAKKRPAAVADLVLSAKEQAAINFMKREHRLGIDRLLQLLAQFREMVSDDRTLFSHLRPEERAAVFTARAISMRDASGCIVPEIIALLPRAQREQEGRRHLTLPALVTRPEMRLPYAAFVPWDEARSILDLFLNDPQAEMRAVVLRTLAKAVRYQRDRLPELLAILRGRAREQDIVRSAMLSELAELPPGIWHTEHLVDLGHIIREALDATDISHATIHALYQLVLRLIPREPAWGAKQLATIVQAHGVPAFGRGLDQWLSESDVLRIAPALQPVLESWEAHENERALQTMAQQFGKRLSVFEGLITVLELVLISTRSSKFADAVLPLFVKYRPERAALLIPDLLQDDPSWITRPAVFTYLHHFRDDLLTPFLGQRVYSGRFSTGKTRFVLPLKQGFVHWTRQQQEMFESTLIGVIHDNALSQHGIIQALEQIAALPALSATPLVAMAEDERSIVRDTVLSLLSKLDAGQGIPTLLEALHDERASKAIYALRAFCMNAPRQQVLTILRNVPFTKITVAKEVVRLLGELPGEEAYQELLALDRQQLHRDVRVALLRSLWNHLDHEETWLILERDAFSPDRAVALSTAHMSFARDKRREQRVVRSQLYRSRIVAKNRGIAKSSQWARINAARIGVSHLSPQIQQRFMHLFVLLLSHPQVEVRSTVLWSCRRIAMADSDNELLSSLLEAMDSQNEDICNAAASAVFGTCIATDGELISSHIQHLLLNRRALSTSTQVIKAALTENRRELVPIVRAILEVLAGDPLTISLGVELALSALPWHEVTAFLMNAAMAGRLHAEAIHRAWEMLQEVTDRPDNADLSQLETVLATSEDEQLRYIALAALLAQAQQMLGWTEELRVRLEYYRADQSVLVASTAQFTFPPNEDN